MRYKLAIFDFDGTLADSFPFFLSVFNQLAERHGFRTVAPDELETLRGYDAKTIMRHLGVPAWKLPVVAGSFIRLMAENRASVSVFEGVHEMLRYLAARGVSLAVVSSNSNENVSEVLGSETTKLIGHFKCGMSIFGKRSHIRDVLKASGIHRENAIYIGDQQTDLHAARAAGVAFGAVSWGYADMASLKAHAPEEEFASISDIKRIA